MSMNGKSGQVLANRVIEVKSKFDAEYRRFSINKSKILRYEEFYQLLQDLHRLKDIPFIVCYTDPKDGDLLPINNGDNYMLAINTTPSILRLTVQRKGESIFEVNGYGTLGRPKKNPITKFMASEQPIKPKIPISMPEDFRRVSAIIDVDIIPETQRRVKLMKNGSDKPLGFYIRDGTSVRVTPHGLEKVPGVFISRLVPGGLAESTGLVAVNDEVLEVNGIEVAGKTLDQVTDMMVANSSNLIITVKPVNQRNNIAQKSSNASSTNSMRQSVISGSSQQSSTHSYDSDEIHDYEEDEDEVKDHLQKDHLMKKSSSSSSNPHHKDTTSLSSMNSNSQKDSPKSEANDSALSASPSTSQSAQDKDSPMAML
uniref:Par6 n=1 Tax=Platynereis dumerilii TaxID=6359 RepID=A0A2H5BF90_PLADU|nr:Par6 [Platynereis dumerilii]